MHRALPCLLCLLCLLCSLTAQSQEPQQNPLDVAILAYWKAHAEASFGEAAAKRDEARNLLAHMPVDAPQFGGWAQGVAGLYQNGGLNAQAREVAEAALARTGRLGDAHPTRLLLLNMLSGFWQQDGNLLKAVTYAEKIASALEAAPPESPGESGAGQATRFSSGKFSNVVVFGNTYARGGSNSNLNSAYQRLASLYQQLGRPEAVAAVMAKMKNLAGDNPYALASLYESQDKFDELAALYRKQAQVSGDPQQSAEALQSLASLYRREQRHGDAAAVLRQAIAGLEASGSPASTSQSFGLRQYLADILQQAGQTGEADKVYQQLLADSQSRQDPNYAQHLASYAGYLDNTKRSGQAESLLSDYMDGHPQLEPWQESNLLYARAGAARASGDSDRASAFERAAMDKNQAMTPIPPDQLLLQTLLQKANTAAWGSNPEEAFSLALEAMEAAPRAVDREQIAWQVPNIASALATKKAGAKAEQLYQQLFAIVRSWSADNLQPLLRVTENYARFLISQKDRHAGVPEAIEAYRKLLIGAFGAGTGHLEEPMRMTIDFERTHGQAKRALLPAGDLLALEESLSGSSSEPYLHAVEMLADLHQSLGDHERYTGLLRQAIAIGDLALPAKDVRRGSARTRLAFALVNERQFEEAERLATEAVAIAQRAHPSQTNPFTQELEQIRKLKAAAAALVAAKEGTAAGIPR